MGSILPCILGKLIETHHKIPTSCRPAPPAGLWQKCSLRTYLIPGPTAERRLPPRAVLPGGGPVQPPAAAEQDRPASVSSTASRRSGARRVRSQHPPSDGCRFGPLPAPSLPDLCGWFHRTPATYRAEQGINLCGSELHQLSVGSV